MSALQLTTQHVRQALYEIVRMDVPFERKAADILDLGTRYLGVDNGHLARVDQQTDHWEALVSTDPDDGRFHAGLELDLGTTYCRRTITEQSQIALHDAPNQGWADDPAFENHNLHCYHGTTLEVNRETYGTLCFVSEEPREEPFSESEQMFTDLIARLLERELETKRQRAELTRQTNLATVLNRVLRHNLRNDMSVIRGYTEQIVDELEDDRDGEIVLRNIDDLLELSRKARELDRVVSGECECEPTEIVGVVEDAVDRVTAETPAASVSVTTDEQITAPILPSFQRAIEELVENAVKHSGEAPTVEIQIELAPNVVEIRITDDGPGIADHEIEVLQSGVETALTHSSGLGLWLARWIVSSHNGNIEATCTGSGTMMTLTVPRKPSTERHQQSTILEQTRDSLRQPSEMGSIQ